MKQFKKWIFILPAFLLSLGLTGCYDNAWENHLLKNEVSGEDLMEVVSANSELSILKELLVKTGYNEVLKLSNNYTVFAPANQAWIGVDTSNVELMRKMIGTLIVYNTYFTENSQTFNIFKAVNGKVLFYDQATATINAAKITTPDIHAANGVIHITDKIVERRENIWDYIAQKTDFQQSQYISSLNKRVMDTEKSIAIGVYPDGKTKYDTIWKNINNFLQKYPLENEDSLYTYIVVENSGFDLLYNKYKKYFKMVTSNQTDSLTRFNICQDFVFKGMIDITKFDTITNVDGVKVPVKDVVIKESYLASNGRVYVIEQSNIRLAEKIKPIKIEGEKYNRAFDASYVFTRYKLWASGQRDIVLAGGETQSDSLWRKVPLAPNTVVTKDSVASKNYFITSSMVSNVNNFFIEFKTNINSADYDLYYVAYDDIADHNNQTGVYKVTQKFFVSMPGAPVLKHGIVDNARGVANNYLGENRCFVGDGLAGRHELTKLKQWNLVATTQLLESPVTSGSAAIMSVPRTGVMTIWLTNTARSTTASRQGLLFLDYILLVPRITEE